MLADEIGVSIPKAMKMAENGAISSSKAIPAILKGMSDKFGGMMQKQSTSLAGLWSTTKDNIGASMRVIGDTLVQTFDLKTKLAGANKWLGDFAAALKDGGMKKALEQMIPAGLRNSIVLISGAIAGAMVPALSLMAIAALKATVPLLPFIVAGAALAGIGLLIAKNWDNIGVKLAVIVGVIGGLLAVVTNTTVALKLWGATTKILTALQVAWNTVMSLNPIGFIVIAIGALILAGVALYKNWDTVKRVALNAWGTIKAFLLNTVASISEAYAKFVSIFNKAEGDRIRASAQRMREQAEAERAIIEERNEAAKGALTDYDARDEDFAQKRTRRAEGVAARAEEAEEQQQQAAQETIETKKDYLDEFDQAFDRSQQDMLESFSRAQEDETTKFQREQEDQLRAYERGLDRQRTAFERELDRRKVMFERSQEDDKIAFEQGLQDQRDKFKDHQGELLRIFKDRQRQEMGAFKRRQAEELEALDSELAARLKPLRAQEKAIRTQEEAEERARRQADLTKRIADAQAKLAEAREKGNPKDIAKAEERLTEALQDQSDFILREQRKTELERIQIAIETVQKEFEVRKEGVRNRQEQDRADMEVRQALQLEGFQKELEADQKHFELRLAQDRLNFERKQADDKTKFEQKLADLKQQKDDELNVELDRFKRGQQEEEKAWKRTQEDRATRYKQELDDLKASFKDKLGQQATFVANWNSMVDQMKAMAPSVSGDVTPAKAPLTPQQTAQQATDNLTTLDKVKAMAKSGQVDAAAKLLSETFGMSLEQAKQNILDGLPKFAAGGVAMKAMAGIFGEKKPEAIMTLDWLGARMADFARRIAAGMVNAAGPARVNTPAIAGMGGGQPTTLLVNLDGQTLARTIVRLMPGELYRIGVK